MKIKHTISILAVAIISFLSIAVYAGSTLSTTGNDIVAHATEEGKNKMSTSTQKPSLEKVNINTASIDQLISLKGIGEQKGQLIIDYRTQHGAFKTFDDLANIKGFSPKILANLQKNNPDRIVVQ